jgi:hypothetical protein
MTTLSQGGISWEHYHFVEKSILPQVYRESKKPE